jgi:hypothetical protein
LSNIFLYHFNSFLYICNTLIFNKKNLLFVMKKNLLLLCFTFLLLSKSIVAQITILDFESAPKTTTFQYFGSSLEPQLTGVINNPDKTGINTSEKVGEFKKPAASQSWAGAFSNPNPTTQVDFTAGGKAIIKVWADHVGNLALKLEGATDGTPNWITKVPITEVNKWVELTFDPTVASIDAPNNTAAGHAYKTVVLFFDFDLVLAAEKTWYFDDLKVQTGSVGPKKTTFNVNMKNYTGTYSKVYVSGTINNWSGDANEMTDPDGDKIYSTELSLPQGGYEYKFTLDNWKAQEEFNGLGLCTITDPSGKFHNRSLTVATDKVLPAVCFNSCYLCGDGVNVTMNLGTSSVTPSPDGVYLVGGGNFDAPGGKHRMQDPDKDGVYTIKFERQKGFQSFFSFANGNCPDYSCKENIAGQPCANAANFNDRKLPPVTKDTTLNTCFGSCSTTTACGIVPKAGKITFKVDMKNVKDVFAKIFVSGTFNNWSADANELTDADKDKIYEVTVPNVAAGQIEYKFQLDGWAKQEQFKGGEPCTITDPSGQFVNRKLTINGDAVLDAVCYNACVLCSKVGTSDLLLNDMIKVQPSIASDNVNVIFAENFEAQTKQISIISLDGKIVARYEVAPNTQIHNVAVGNFANGLYLLQAKVGVFSQTVKIVVNH